MFKSAHPFDHGTPVFLRTKPSCHARAEDGWQGGKHAQVVWCRLSQAVDTAGLYQVGAKYFDPV